MISDIVEKFDDNEDSFNPPVPPPTFDLKKNQSFPKPSSKKFASWKERKKEIDRRKAQEQMERQMMESDNDEEEEEQTNSLEKSEIANALRKANSKHKSDKDFTESERIHIENLERLMKMSEEEIEAEKSELMAMMDEKVLRKLLDRAIAKEQANDGMLDNEEVDHALGVLAEKDKSEKAPHEQQQQQEKKKKKSVSFDVKTKNEPTKKKKKDLSTFSIQDVGVEGLDDDERYPTFEQLQQIQKEFDEASNVSKQREANVHFPKDTTGDDLDPNDDQFLDKLHAKYFPSLQAEPEKLEWMMSSKKMAKDDIEAEYSETRDGLYPKEIRFDFKGNILSPRQSKQLPTYLGLHHHGDQPDAAGYTIPELAHLARSSVNSQRSIAIQTLGRILYKLGRGEYGSQIGAGLWGLVDQGRVIDSITEASDEKKTSSMTVRAYAVEALWLWQQGGGARPAV